MSAIRRLARQIAEEFRPDQIILFGSYAYGEPTAESDVDILVVMPATDELSKASRIRSATEHPFRLDLHVRTPENLRWRLEAGDWFLRDVVGKGKVLYETAASRAADGRTWPTRESAPPIRQYLDGKGKEPMKRLTAEWVRKAEADWLAAKREGMGKPPLYEVACFHCQQAAEKYFKAMLQQLGLPVPRTHELNPLLDMLLPHDVTLASLRRGLGRLSDYAVDVRYPGTRVTARKFQIAFRLTELVRQEIRTRLGLRPRRPRRKRP
jgi:HEPN domain-containing protein/predicted nucleotidyltransferase